MIRFCGRAFMGLATLLGCVLFGVIAAGLAVAIVAGGTRRPDPEDLDQADADEDLDGPGPTDPTPAEPEFTGPRHMARFHTSRTRRGELVRGTTSEMISALVGRALSKHRVILVDVDSWTHSADLREFLEAAEIDHRMTRVRRYDGETITDLGEAPAPAEPLALAGA